MSHIKQASKVTSNRYWAAIAPVLLLAPLALAAKGCDAATIGDDCPEQPVGKSYYPQPAQSCAGSGSTAGAENGNGSAGSSGAGASNAGSSSTAGTGNVGNTGNTAGSTGSGATCGGLQGMVCPKSEYCVFPNPDCGAADQLGKCETKPEACDDIYAPVCGCDGKDYASDCTAAAAGFGVLHTGKCNPNSSGTTCGGLTGAACQKGEYCSYELGAQCGANDQTGTCTTVPTGACLTVYQPVCGCDGKTYSNDCAAGLAGVSIMAVGACAADTDTVCGGITGKACAKSAFCDYPADSACGNADIQGTCKPIPNACTDNVALVCGCDGKTYGNACGANAAGVSVYKTGQCPAM